MSTYRYLFYDLFSLVALGELPLKGVTFTRRLNRAGEGAGMIAMADPNVQAERPVDMTRPGRTAVFFERDGVLLFGGILWKATYQSTDQTWTLGVEDYFTYFSRRVLNSTKAYTATDPLTIAMDLIAWTKTLANGDIGIQVVTMGSSGQAVTQRWDPWNLKVIADALRELAATGVGFDWGMDTAWAGGVPQTTLTLSYPRRGRPAPDTGLVWEYPPGNVSDYVWQEDGTEIAVTTYAVGGGSGATMPVGSSSNPGMLDAGYPLLEAVYSHTDVTDPNTLGLIAGAEAYAHSGPLVLPVLTVRADLEPVIGSYTEGDDCRIRITDPRFPAVGTGPGLDAYFRIQEITVTPQDDAPETVLLTLGPVP